MSARRLALAAAALASAPALPARAQDEPKQGIQPLRYDDDFRYLATQPGTDLWDPIKYISLGTPDSFLSLGGELRERFEAVANRQFGLSPDAPRDAYLLQRVLVHADLQLGPQLRVFVQLGDHRAPGKARPLAPTDVDHLDLQQGFVDVSAGPVTLRAGRQEILFGSQRLVAVREAPNVRRSFDALRGIVKAGRTEVSLLVARPVANRAGAFDDGPDRTQRLWGVYATRKLGADTLDLYYLGLYRQNARFAAAAADERRHSFGTRWSGKAGALDYDWEAVYQFGRFGPARIAAWTVATDTGYSFVRAPWQLRVGLKADFASGDRASARTLGTFNALYPRSGYFTEAGFVSPSNIANLSPSLAVRPTKKLTVTATLDLLWRASRSDAFYSEGGVAIPGSATAHARRIGAEAQLEASLQLSRRLQLNAAYVRFQRGPLLRQIGGRSADYAAIWGAYKF